MMVKLTLSGDACITNIIVSSLATQKLQTKSYFCNFCNQQICTMQSWTTSRQTDRHADRQTDMQTDRQTHM